jgi:hypothetical protein
MTVRWFKSDPATMNDEGVSGRSSRWLLSFTQTSPRNSLRGFVLAQAAVVAGAVGWEVEGGGLPWTHDQGS